MFFVLTILLFPGLSFSGSMLKIPPAAPPAEYGDVLIDRESAEKKDTPVVFSHWVHRVKYTCRVCHNELDFAMKANDTPIVCNNGEMRGEYCATCHNGKVSFGPKDENGENCRRCHNADSSPNRAKFFELQKKLPRTAYGNQIDWVTAMNNGLIKPLNSLSANDRHIVFDKTLTLKAEMSGIPSASFPHKTHEEWLDCSNCHPELFNIKKKTTRNLTMNNLIKGESCAICHLRVAFPLDDCKRCHPTMRMNW